MNVPGTSPDRDLVLLRFTGNFLWNKRRSWHLGDATARDPINSVFCLLSHFFRGAEQVASAE